MNRCLKQTTKILAISLAVLVNLSACSSNSDSISTTFSTTGYRLETEGELVYIDSDAVNRAGYDAKTQLMTVEFDNLSVYAYANVPQTIWTEFYDAQPNPWHEVGYPKIAYKFEYKVLFDPN